MSELALFDHPAGTLLAVVLGLALVVAGRRLFWLAIGVAGFFVGLVAASQLLELQPLWLELLVAILAGIVGALLAVFLQRAVVGIAGFFAGGWLALEVWRLSGQEGGAVGWLLFLVGGVAAAILAVLVFDLALVAVSSLLGAKLIVDASGVVEPSALVLLLVIAGAGVLIQLAFRRRSRPR
jgi:hypothetical protein